MLPHNQTCPAVIGFSECSSLYIPVKNNSGVTPAGQCGTWVKEPDGGYFTSPNYPEKYPPERECVYIIEGNLCAFPSVASTPLTFSPPAFTCSLSSAVHRLIL